MRIFISHSSKNSDFVLKFAEFLESTNNQIEVFCSSENGSINIGTDFINTIFKELGQCDVFVPIISEEYYASKFCMIELGVAYAYLCSHHNNGSDDYIFPFALYPVKKGHALAGTPIANLQTGDLTDENDIRNFLDVLVSKGINIRAGINRKIHLLEFDLNQIILRTQNILSIAKFGAYFDDSILYKSKEDIVRFSVSGNEITVNYNMNPYNRNDVKRPNFISMVLKYIDPFDMGRYLNCSGSAKFCCSVTSFTDSLSKIFIEMKYSDNHAVLASFEFPIKHGINQLSIPLEAIKCNALSNITEICFVIHPDDVVEDEGMFSINDVKII